MKNKYKIIATILLFSSASLFGADEQTSISLSAPRFDFLSLSLDIMAYLVKALAPAVGIGLGLYFFARATGLLKFFAGGGKEHYNEFLEYDKQTQEARYKKWIARKKGMDAEDREAFEQLKEDYANLVDDKQAKKRAKEQAKQTKEQARKEFLINQGFLESEIDNNDFRTRDLELSEDSEESENSEDGLSSKQRKRKQKALMQALEASGLDLENDNGIYIDDYTDYVIFQEASGLDIVSEGEFEKMENKLFGS